MHSLDVIIARNAQAAGREAAHATNDAAEARDAGQDERAAALFAQADAIHQAQTDDERLFLERDGVSLITSSFAADIAFLNYNAGYNAGRQES